MSRYDSYEEVKALSLDAQRELLWRGDNEERIWATWAVAAELAGGFAPDLDRQAVAEPTGGVRRHMIVVLAGMGEYALLREFAERDPDALVRATSCQYVLRMMTDAGEARRYALGRLETDASHDVWKAVTLEAIRKADVLTLDDLVALASNAVTDIRVAAVSEIARRDQVASALAEGLDGCFVTEPEGELLDRLVGFAVECGHATDVLRAARRSEASRALFLLDLLLGRDQRFDWARLQSLAEGSGEDLDMRLVLLLKERDSRHALHWLFGALARRVRDGFIEDWPFADAAGEILGAAIDQFLADPATPPDPGDLAKVRACVERRIEDYENTDGWDDYDYFDEGEWRAARSADLRLLKKIQRLG